jgi:rhamnose transport system permease protein
MFINGAVILGRGAPECAAAAIQAHHPRGAHEGGQSHAMGDHAGGGADCRVHRLLDPVAVFPECRHALRRNFNFTERAIVALLALLIIAGEIDISVAAIIACWLLPMGLASAQEWVPRASVAIGLGTGLLPAANGAPVTIGRVPSIVATIGTMTLFRGAAYAVLGDRVLKDYPDSFAIFGQGYLVGPISIELALFTLFAILFGVFLHRTRWGRVTFAVGANPVDRPYWHWLSVGSRCLLTGLFSGVAAVPRACLTRPDRAGGSSRSSAW